MTNFWECIWYMKSDFIIFCLVGMKKTLLFMLEYKDISMSWIDKFFNVSIHAVEHDIDEYKKSKKGKTVEMMFLPVTLFNNIDKVSIEDQVLFILEDVLQSVFCKYKLAEVCREKCFLTSWKQSSKKIS